MQIIMFLKDTYDEGARSQRKRTSVTVQVHPVLLRSRGTVVDMSTDIGAFVRWSILS